MKTACIIQARMGSTRLPGKVMSDIAGKPMLAHVFERAKQIPVDMVIGAFVDEKASIPLLDLAAQYGVRTYCGDEHDVLGRYYKAARQFGVDQVMRITGDCPLIDPEACARVYRAMQTGLFDYVANDIHASYPAGLGCEMFTFQALEMAHKETNDPFCREHVFPWIREHKEFTGLNIRCEINGLSKMRLTIDTKDDLEFIRAIYSYQPKDFSLVSTLECVDSLNSRVRAP